jgi:hypothetical protein
VVGADVLDARSDGDQPCARQGLSVQVCMPLPCPPVPLTHHSYQLWGRPWQPPSNPAEGRQKSSRAADLPSGSHQCHCVPTALGETRGSSNSVSSRGP